MQRIRVIANEFFKKCEIMTLPISQCKINEILKTNDWELRYYSVSKNIIASLELNEYSETHNGFTYIEDDKTIIFIRDELNYLEKINVICHEMGHILLGHTSSNGVLGKSKDKNYENVLENEADIFSIEFQAPIFMLLQENYDTADKIFNAGILNKELSEVQYKELLEYKDKLKKENLLFSYKVKLIVVICIFTVIYIQTTSKYSKETIIETNTEITTQSYINETITELATEHTMSEFTIDSSNALITPQSSKKVKTTKSGKKYHLPNCKHVAYKTNTIELDIEEAVRMGYTPCSDCNPN